MRQPGCYRTLVRVVAVTPHTLRVCLPAWNHRRTVAIKKAGLPAWLLQRAEPGYRCHAVVNTGVAIESHELTFDDWESE